MSSKVIIALVMIMAGIVLASAGPTPLVIPFDEITIWGKVWNSEHNSGVEGANITINCNNHIQNLLTVSNGNYGTNYSLYDCPHNSNVTVYAFKGTESGTESDQVGAYGTEINLTLISITLTPEFGIITGIITLFGALGIFFYMRK